MGFKPDLNDQLVSYSALTLLVWSSACKNRPQNDLSCVEWDVKPLHCYYFIINLAICWIVSCLLTSAGNYGVAAAFDLSDFIYFKVIDRQ